MNHDALIFDIDGTLWDASPASAKGWNSGLAQLGFAQRVSADTQRSVAGNPYETCVEILLPGLTALCPELPRVLSSHETEAVKAEGGELYPGVADGIRQLSRRYPLFVVSNCQDWYLPVFLDLSGLGPLFSGADCHGISRLPKSEMISRMIQTHSLGAPAYIGDTAGDAKAAAAAGIAFLFAEWGFGEPEATWDTARSFPDLLTRFANGSSEPHF